MWIFKWSLEILKYAYAHDKFYNDLPSSERRFAMGAFVFLITRVKFRVAISRPLVLEEPSTVRATKL